MKRISAIVLAILMVLTSGVASAFESGDQVYYLHGPDDSHLKVSQGQIIKQHSSSMDVYFEEYGKTLNLRSSVLFGDKTLAHSERRRRDESHMSKAEVLIGGAAIAGYVLCRLSGGCGAK